MSYNRGVKRNSSGNRNFNRNAGGIGMGVGGSSSHGLNPWESGVMPGRGILPTPSNSNLSLNSPQAQLVIASNLLSNLLRNQQDTQPQVPSLLSLGTGLNGPNSNFRGSQSFSNNRYNDRQGRGNLKSHRSQPYGNKMGNRARDAVANRRGPSSAQHSRAQSNQRINGNQNQHRNDKSKANSDSKKNQTVKKEQQDPKSSDNEKADTQLIAKSEEDETTSEMKTEEDGEKEQEEITSTEVAENDDKSKIESIKNSEKDSPSKKTEESAPAGKKSEARHAESRYASVPINQMFCHVCNKHMWDGFSFENHLRGRAHQLMMDKLDESYKLRVDFMRHELKVAEEQRELSLHNSKRRGKKIPVDLNVREYCTMCDLHFYGTLSTHRKSEKHQQLKIFLHPRCVACAKEFPSRIEYDEHCLTPGHMANAVQIEEQKKTRKNKLAKGESEVRTADDEDKDSGSDPKGNENDDELPENTEYITDIKEDIDMTKYKIPSYKHCRQNQLEMGASLVKQVEGFHCEKCRRFMLTEEDMKSHLRTITHYRSFVTELKALTTPVTAESNDEKSAIQEGENKIDDLERDSKRRKLDTTIESEAEVKDESMGDENNLQASPEKITENKEEEEKNESGNDKYDPMEADVESEEESTKLQTDKEEKEKEKEEDKVVEKEVQEKDKEKEKEKSEKENTNVSNEDEKSIEAWDDGDNEAEFGFGNLLGDDNEEQEDQSAVQQKSSSQKTQSTPQAQPQPNKLSATAGDSPTKLNNSQDKGTPPRGRSYRGRGHQRARRSRR